MSQPDHAHRAEQTIDYAWRELDLPAGAANLALAARGAVATASTATYDPSGAINGNHCIAASAGAPEGQSRGSRPLDPVDGRDRVTVELTIERWGGIGSLIFSVPHTDIKILVIVDESGVRGAIYNPCKLSEPVPWLDRCPHCRKGKQEHVPSRSASWCRRCARTSQTAQTATGSPCPTDTAWEPSNTMS